MLIWLRGLYPAKGVYQDYAVLMDYPSSLCYITLNRARKSRYVGSPLIHLSGGISGKSEKLFRLAQGPTPMCAGEK